MRINSFNLQPYYAVETETPIGGGDLSVEDMIDEMAKDTPLGTEEKVDDKTPPEVDLLKEEKEDKTDKEEKEDGEEGDEEKIELDEEEQEPEIDETEPIEGISRKEILKAYPDLFKKFPQVEKAIYREKAYAEVFPTVEDAKEAGAKVQNYDRFEQQALNGDIDEVLASVKSADSKAFNKLVDNYLPMLGKVDQQAYFHIIGNVTKNIIVGMVNESKKSENEDLKAAAVLLHQYMFGNSEFKAVEPYGPHKPDEKEDKLSQEKEEFARQKFEASLETLATANTNVIKSTISHHIDPKGVMSDYVKKTAIKEALEEVEATMNSNTRFKANMDKLWQQVFKTNYSRAALDNVKRAHLNQAKVILRPIIMKHRNAALRGMGKRVSDEREEPTKKGPVSVGRSATANNSGKKEMTVPKGMSAMDFLMSD